MIARAAVMHGVNRPLEIEEVTVDAPTRREVLVRTAAAGICHSDAHFVEGKEAWDLPTVLGHEGAGVVEAVGESVSYVEPGDRVATCLSVFCGACEYCLTGRPSLCESAALDRPDGATPRLRMGGEPIHQFLSVSAFAEWMLVHENALVKIGDRIPFDRAALLGCAVVTGLGAVFNTARVAPTSSVVVLGCGGVGLNCVQGAAIAGAAQIVAVDRLDAKLDLAKSLGATDLVNADRVDPVDEVLRLSGGGVDYAFEAIGLKETIEQCFAVLRAGGVATVIGVVAEGTTVELPAVRLLQELKLQGSSVGSNRFRIEIPRYVRLYEQGRLKLDELVYARIPLDSVNDGLDSFRRGDVGRSVIVFD
jgi:S-(hydroxymethyl)glutathione dehydrogenase / alcohol dehydrogenase